VMSSTYSPLSAGGNLFPFYADLKSPSLLATKAKRILADIFNHPSAVGARSRLPIPDSTTDRRRTINPATTSNVRDINDGQGS